MKQIEVERRLLSECFALLGVAEFGEKTLSDKRKQVRDELLDKLKVVKTK